MHINDTDAPPEEASTSLSPSYEVVPNDVGAGLRARRAWRAGELIGSFAWVNRSPRPSRWTLQIGPEEHAELQPSEFLYINHSCAPNVVFDIEGTALRAIRDIAPGEELCFFYPATEWEMAERFVCRCGARDCCGEIAGASQMPEERLAPYELSGVIRALLQARRLEHDRALPATSQAE